VEKIVLGLDENERFNLEPAVVREELKTTQWDFA
jgi:hypothetical protein